jgi:hypothetical protein
MSIYQQAWDYVLKLPGANNGLLLELLTHQEEAKIQHTLSHKHTPKHTHMSAAFIHYTRDFQNGSIFT